MSDNKQSPDPRIIKLTNVRLSYPVLFRPKKFKGNEDDPKKIAKYSASFILDKTANAGDIRKIQAAIELVLREDAKGKKLPPDRLCLRDGTVKPDTDGYGPENVFLTSSNEKKPRVVDGNLEELDEQSGKPYAGCYVDAVVRLWWQDNQWGKRVNANLRVVQYRRKGESFGEGQTNIEEYCEKIEEEDESVV